MANRRQKRKTYNYNDEQMKIIKAREYNRGAIDSLKTFMPAAVLILHEDFGFGAVKKLPKFIERINLMYADWYKGKTNQHKLAERVKNEIGIVFQDKEY